MTFDSGVWRDPDARRRFVDGVAASVAAEKWWGPTAGAVARSFTEHAVVVLSPHADPSAVLRDAQGVLDDVYGALDGLARPPGSPEELGAAVGDEFGEAVGRAVADGYRLAVTDGAPLNEDRVVVAVGAQAPGHRTDRVFGARVPVRHRDGPDRTLLSPLILLVDGDFVRPGALGEVTSTAAGQGRPLLVVAGDLGDGVAAALASQLPPVDAVTPVGHFASSRSAFLGDLAVLTGARLVAHEAGLRGALLGGAMVATLDADEATIVHPAGKPAAVRAHLAELRRQFATTTSDYDREKLAGRISDLAAGVVVISVGDPLPLGRVQWGLDLAQWALRLGVVPGGGVAFSTVRQQLTASGSLAGAGGDLAAAALSAAEQVLGSRRVQPLGPAKWVLGFAFEIVRRLVTEEHH